MDNKKVFVIINSYYIGDIVLVNSLIQNIKRIYEDSIVVMLTSPQLQDVARYQLGVDDVIIWDRKGEHKGFWKMLKFALQFPYKKIYAAFPIYSMDRPVILSKLLGAKYILGPMRKLITKLILKSKYPIIADWSSTQRANMELLSGITKEKLFDCPVKFNPPEIKSQEILGMAVKDYIVLCPKTSRVAKDIPNERIFELAEKYNSNIVLLGNGEEAEKLSKEIEQRKCANITNLIGKTSILESAQIIQHSRACICADTGMLHISCALGRPTVGVFCEKKINAFAPKEEIYPYTKCIIDDSAEEIIKTLDYVIQKTQ